MGVRGFQQGITSTDAAAQITTALVPYSTTAQAALLYQPIVVVQYATPATLATVTVAAGTTMMIIEPAGTIAALTLNLPAVPTNGLGTVITVLSTQIVSTLTLGAGASTIIGGLAAFAASGFASYVYRSGFWYRCG